MPNADRPPYIGGSSDRPIAESERKYRRPLGRRRDDRPGLTALDSRALKRPGGLR